MIRPIDEAAALAAWKFGDTNSRLAMSVPRCHCGEGPVLASVAMLARNKARCAWLRVAPRLLSFSSRSTAWALPGRDGKAGSSIEPESRICEVAARTTASRFGLRATTPHLDSDDLVAIQAEDQVEVEPAPLDLAMRAQHTMEAGLAGEVDPLVGQRRDDPRRRRLGKARFVGHRDDPGPFGLAQSV
jgi:hypothetical protein